MKTAISAALLAILAQPALAQGTASEVIETAEGERALRQSLVVDADLATTWALFTTSEGAAKWMAPVGEVDLRTGGSIRTNYDPCAAPGDPGSITNTIVNFIPQRMITLQADLEPQREAAWMNEAIYARRHRLYSVIEFAAVDASHTRITIWGLGYGEGEEWETMLAFFTTGNEWTFGQLEKAVAGEQVYPACGE